MNWGKSQKKPIVTVFTTFGDVRIIAYSDFYVEDAGDVDRIQDQERKLRKFFASLTSCMSGDANRVVRNSGDSQGHFTMNMIQIQA